MRRVIQVLILSGFLSIALAESVSQTNWFGNQGHWGPNTFWYYYYSSNNISGFPSLTLSSPKHTIDEDFDGARSVHSADINGDGSMDVLGAAFNGGDITWWENAGGSGTTWIEHTVDGDFNGAHSVYSSDVNGDGFMDVLGAAYMYANEITWWENVDGSGTSWIKHSVDEYFSGAYSVYSIDVNGDGFMDVLGAARGADDITWWENVDGSGTSWVKHTVDGGFDGAYSVYSIDVNGDGFMDVLGAASEANEITWWENVDGSGTSWVEHTVDSNYHYASSVFSTDVNGDGYMDVLGAAYLGDEITWWENVGGSGTSWVEHTVDGGYNGPVSVYSTDVNGDGFMDVLGAASSGNEITWWENVDGSGTGWIKHIVAANIIWASSVYAVDVNGDGFKEVLGAASLADEIVWWDVSEFELDGWLESSCLFLGNDPGWGEIHWTGTEPLGTVIAFQVRSSDSPDSNAMGSWSDTLHSPCGLAGILEEYDSYFQYRVILQTSDSAVTPVLDDVTITWNPLGMEGVAANELQLFPISPNPSSGFPIIKFSLPEPGSVELSVLDVSGRIVRKVGQYEYSAGYHDVQLENLSSGIYFCRMTLGESAATQRFVVLE